MVQNTGKLVKRKVCINIETKLYKQIDLISKDLNITISETLEYIFHYAISKDFLKYNLENQSKSKGRIIL